MADDPKLKPSPNLIIAAATAGIVLVVGLSVGLWLNLGKNSPPSRVAITTSASAARRPTHRQPAAQVAPVSPAILRSADVQMPDESPFEPPKKASAGSSDAKGQGTKGPGAALSEDVAAWKKQDYFRARQENSPLLLKAVERLGKTAHNDAAAQGLTDLLKPIANETPPANPPQGAARPARNAASDSKLVDALVSALGNNGSDLAQKTLEQILDGTLATDDDKIAVAAALKTLAAHPGPPSDALLLRAMTDPESLRPADRQGVWSARDLRLKALELFKPAGPGELRAAVVSDEFRTALAEAVANRFEKFDPQDPIRECLLAADPLNCDAQVVLYINANTSKETKARLEQQFAAFGSAALSRLMGLAADELPASPGRPLAAAVAADFDPQFIMSLWSDRFRAAFDPQLDDLRSWEKQPQTILLAGTIPQDSTRSALCKALRKHQTDGPRALEAAGWLDRMTTDPGLLVIVKLLSRKEGKSAGPGQPSANPLRAPIANATNKLEAARQASQRKAQADQEWMAFCAKLVVTWCRRLNDAFQAKESTVGQTRDDVKAKLPADIELDASAKPTVVYHVVWPADIASAIAPQKTGLLDLYYVRAVETGKMKRAMLYYNRQAKAKLTDVRTIDRGVWIESPRPAAAQSNRRSLDVLITRSDDRPVESGKADSTKDKDDEDAELVIEILSIEIKDPVVRE